MMNQICETATCKYVNQTVRINEWFERYAPGPWWNPANGNMDTANFTVQVLASLKLQLRQAEAILNRGRHAGQDWERAALDAENYLHRCIGELEGRGG